MSNSSAIFLEYEGKIVPRSFAAGYVVLSYLVSFVGAWTTLELINKRTADRGLYNWYLLIGSSISMGGIAIWCMHFIGNRAIILAGGTDNFQIAYDPGFTTLSFFVPILVLLAAFMAVGTNDKVSIIRLSLGGILTGLAICGMHYLGQTRILNYTLVYQIKNIVGATVVAIFASFTALTVFFVLRASWINSWWKRAGTAILLAGAVSGMHWLASIGTQYRLRQIGLSAPGHLSENSTVIFVIVLSIAACFILLIFTLIAQRRRSKSANRAQQVVLTAGIFDSEGRIMVTADGELPMQKITNQYIERTFDDEFGKSHPAFLWIFRASRNWPSIAGLIPAMRNHIQHMSRKQGSFSRTTGTELSLTNDAGEPIEDYSIIFRELFCVAAFGIATQMGEPLENIGVLFDEILSTGQTVRSKDGKLHNSLLKSSSLEIEQDSLKTQFGRGQLLFVTRCANRREAEKLTAKGFRFAAVPNVVNILAASMQISSTNLFSHIQAMRDYSVKPRILEPGVHMACFAIRASVSGGFDVMVRRDASNQLPTMQLPLAKLDSWQVEYLTHFDGITVAQCLETLKSKTTISNLPKTEKIFAAQLYAALEALRDEINDPFFSEALMIAKPFKAPCRGTAVPGKATIIAFRIIVAIHSRAPGQKLEFTPLSFFKAQQRVYENSPDQAVFARKIHREFGPILNQPTPGTTPEARSPTFPPARYSGRKSLDVRSRIQHKHPNPESPTERLPFWSRENNKSSKDIELGLKEHSNNSSEHNQVETRSFGGIMVSKEVTINVNKLADTEEGDEDEEARVYSLEKPRNGTTRVVIREVEDADTYVDEIFAVCVERR